MRFRRVTRVCVVAVLVGATSVDAAGRILRRPPPAVAAAGNWADCAEHPQYSVAQFTLTNRTGLQCSIQHVAIFWTEKETNAQHVVDVRPEELTLPARGSVSLQATVEEWDVDRAKPPDVQVVALQCQ